MCRRACQDGDVADDGRRRGPGDLQGDQVAGERHGRCAERQPGRLYARREFYGSDSFGFTATDGDATSVEAKVALTVTEVNDPPTAASDSATTAEDTPVPIDARANDSKGPANGVGCACT